MSPAAEAVSARESSAVDQDQAGVGGGNTGSRGLEEFKAEIEIRGGRASGFAGIDDSSGSRETELFIEVEHLGLGHARKEYQDQDEQESTLRASGILFLKSFHRTLFLLENRTGPSALSSYRKRHS